MLCVIRLTISVIAVNSFCALMTVVTMQTIWYGVGKFTQMTPAFVELPFNQDCWIMMVFNTVNSRRRLIFELLIFCVCCVISGGLVNVFSVGSRDVFVGYTNNGVMSSPHGTSDGFTFKFNSLRMIDGLLISSLNYFAILFSLLCSSLWFELDPT